jgi:hypothetical protein
MKRGDWAQKRHWDGKAEASVSALCQFRNYLHYHIKASKAYMHVSATTEQRQLHRPTVRSDATYYHV